MHKLIGSLITAAVLASPAALAGVTANVGVASEYLFRGIPQTNGAAVQGGLDLATDSGVYAGTWVSNVNFSGVEGGNELDVYGGWTRSFGALALDVGAIAYVYSEASEANCANECDVNFVEAYLGGTVGPLAAKVYYSPDYNGSALVLGVTETSPSLYGTATVTLPVSEKLGVFVQAGSLTWDNVDSYIDASAGFSSAPREGLSLSLSAVATRGRGPVTAPLHSPTADHDEVKFVVSAKQSFGL